MAVTEEILVALRAAGQAAFKSAMDSSAESIGGITREAGKAETAVTDTGKAAAKTQPQWRKTAGTLAKWAGGAAAIYGAKRGIEASVNATQDLAKSTLTIQRATGLDTKTASEWATVTQARGIQTKQFQVGLTKLSKTMEAARGGNDKAAQSLYKLGINQDMIAKGDISGALTRSADAFALMKNPAEKAATAQALFGKSGQALVPLLQGGSAGLQEQLGLADKYGATLSDKAAGGAKDLIARQREMKIALQGVQVSMGTALMPVILSFSQVLLQVTQAMQPLLRDTTLLKVVIAAVTLAFLAYKIAIIASTIATLGFNASILLIPLAVIAVAAAFVIAYKKVGWFRDAVNAVFNWIKTNWPLLLAILVGPFGLAVLAIVKNFGKIKSAATDAAHWIANAFRNVIAFFRRLPGAILSAISGLGDKILKSLTPGGLAGKLIGKVAGRQYGGVVRPGETTLVGERGPELLSLPGGSRVTPIAAGGATTARFYLDRRLIATAVAQADADQRARR